MGNTLSDMSDLSDLSDLPDKASVFQSVNRVGVSLFHLSSLIIHHCHSVTFWYEWGARTPERPWYSQCWSVAV